MIDYWLESFTINLPTKLRDSQDLLDRIRALGPLPRGARLWTADAVSMYTNIDTDLALVAIRTWLETFADELP